MGTSMSVYASRGKRLSESHLPSLKDGKLMSYRARLPRSWTFNNAAAVEKLRNEEATITPEHQTMTFTNEEIELLRTSFDEAIKQRREKIAVDIFDSVSNRVSGAIAIYSAHQYKLSDNWAALGLGIILLSGIERCLLRLDKPQHLQSAIERLAKSHVKDMNVPSQMMIDALRACQPVLLTHICVLRKHCELTGLSGAGEHCPVSLPANSVTTTCTLCRTWFKFFDHICNCFSATNNQRI